MSDDARWRYERGEGRSKHRWKNDFAGFEPGDRGPIGKCACSIDQETAESLLNSGVPFREPADEEDHPSRIYAIYQGAIYEAVPTIPGVSYHGYPWRGDLPGHRRLPKRILKELEALATDRDELKEFERWLKRYTR